MVGEQLLTVAAIGKCLFALATKFWSTGDGKSLPASFPFGCQQTRNPTGSGRSDSIY
jgi:hypothetical protein